MNDKLNDFVCRICLEYETSNMISLVDTNGLSYYGKAIKLITNVEIVNYDGLPSKMCRKCLVKLKQAIQFKQNCEQNNMKLNKLKSEYGVNRIIEYYLYLRYFSDTLDENNDVNIIANNNEHDNDYLTIPESNDNENENDLFDQMKKMINESSEETETKANDREVHSIIDNDDSNDDEILSQIDKMIQQSLSGVAISTPKRPYKRFKRIKEIRKDGKIRKVLVKYQKQSFFDKQKNKNSKVTCHVCQKILANETSMAHHMQKHTGYKFICELCARGFPRRAELKMHQASIHGIGKSYQCEHCNFKSARRFELVEHVRSHTGERPFACERCGLTFRRRCVWRKHGLLHHDRTVQCPHCPRRFFDRANMLAHSNNVHERLYVYACPECAVTYAKCASVRRHLVQIHGVPRERQGAVRRLSAVTRRPTVVPIDNLGHH